MSLLRTLVLLGMGVRGGWLEYQYHWNCESFLFLIVILNIVNNFGLENIQRKI